LFLKESVSKIIQEKVRKHKFAEYHLHLSGCGSFEFWVQMAQMFPVQWDRDERPIQNLPPLKPEEFKLEKWIEFNGSFEEYWEKFEKRFDSREDRILKPNPLIWEFLIIQTLWDYWKSGVGYIEFSLGRKKLFKS